MYELYYFVPSLWTFALLVSIIILYSRTSKLTDKVNKLEQQISVLKVNDIKTAQKVETQMQSVKEIDPNYIVGDQIPQNFKYPLSAQELSKPEGTPLTQRISITEDENVSSPIADWFKENLLLKIGVILIILGVGWFVSYAFANNWIGPVGRITLGIVLGTLVTLFGTFRLSRNKVQGNAFTILGSALIIITLLAGQYYYDFFAPTLVLMLVFAVSLYVNMTAVASDEEKLAIYGMFISVLAPILSHTADMNLVLLYMYLGVTSVAAIWISIVKNWKNVALIGITGILVYSFGNIFGGSMHRYNLKYIVLLITYSISLFYMLVGIWSMVRNGSNTDSKEAYVTILNSIIILGFTTSIIPTIYQSLVIAIWMLVYAFTGFFVFARTKNLNLFYLHSCIAILLLAIATSIELSGQTLVIAFAIEAAIITIASFIATNSIRTAETTSFLMLVPVFMSLQSVFSNNWRPGVFILHSDFFVLVLVMSLLALLGIFFKLNSSGGTSKDASPSQIMFIASSMYFYVLVWLCNHSIILNQDSAVFASLFIYTIIGLGTHFYGLFSQKDSLKKYGMVILIMVVARLVLVDVWNMELLLRVITFVVLGVMFISSTFISKHQTNSNLIK